MYNGSGIGFINLFGFNWEMIQDVRSLYSGRRTEYFGFKHYLALSEMKRIMFENGGGGKRPNKIKIIFVSKYWDGFMNLQNVVLLILTVEVKGTVRER